ncbi:30S ribosomal protein S1 isoform X1 [Ricinus communis]|uniref:30S ribosomal protein S1 isoform X1 n=1 Tax=Ricinus communis TaxID=3988 RepID=UPI00201B07E6|nr:30S ribosomal protein S1 isoform X1 [Ricinus communis]
MPIFTALHASVSAHSLLSQLFTSNDASLTHTLSTHFSSCKLFHKSRHSISAAARVSVSENSNDSATTTGFLEDSPDAIRQTRRSADWKAARAYRDSGSIFEGRIEGFNGGGLLVRFYSLVGFLPFPQLSPSHSCKEPQISIHEIARGLNGSSISVKVLQAEEESRKLIFSEKEAEWSKFSKRIKVGDIFVGRVGSTEDYGAFVHLLFPDGLYHLTGLVHVSEVSWDLVQDVRDVLNEGDNVKVKIINIDRQKSRMTLSIKQLEEDPLLETLDKVIPQDGSVGLDPMATDSSNTIEPLLGLEVIIQELLREDGVDDVRINRQGFEKRAVSQDLQLWLSNAPPVNRMFTLLARAGRQVQEIQLTTTLDQEGIKKALQRVLERVP